MIGRASDDRCIASLAFAEALGFFTDEGEEVAESVQEDRRQREGGRRDHRRARGLLLGARPDKHRHLPRPADNPARRKGAHVQQGGRPL